MSIALTEVTYRYGVGTPFAKTALDAVTLTIHKGEFVGIIGHTGSGKSTLVQHLNGLLHPATGTVCVEGIDLAGKSEEARRARHRVGMVFQYAEHQLFEETIAKDIAFGPRNLGCDEEEVERRVRDAMEFVGLDYAAYADRSPFHLSGGQMRRVAIAGVLALEPDYLILDEPSAGLDPCGRDEIFERIRQLHAERGMTVILVSHNMEDIARLAERLIVMEGGQVLFDDTPTRLFTTERARLRGAGVDIPPLNVLLESLAERGLPVRREVRTMEEAVETIRQNCKVREESQTC